MMFAISGPVNGPHNGGGGGGGTGPAPSNQAQIDAIQDLISHISSAHQRDDSFGALKLNPTATIGDLIIAYSQMHQTIVDARNSPLVRPRDDLKVGLDTAGDQLSQLFAKAVCPIVNRAYNVDNDYYKAFGVDRNADIHDIQHNWKLLRNALDRSSHAGGVDRSPCMIELDKMYKTLQTDRVHYDIGYNARFPIGTGGGAPTGAASAAAGGASTSSTYGSSTSGSVHSSGTGLAATGGGAGHGAPPGGGGLGTRVIPPSPGPGPSPSPRTSRAARAPEDRVFHGEDNGYKESVKLPKTHLQEITESHPEWEFSARNISKYAAIGAPVVGAIAGLVTFKACVMIGAVVAAPQLFFGMGVLMGLSMGAGALGSMFVAGGKWVRRAIYNDVMSCLDTTTQGLYHPKDAFIKIRYGKMAIARMMGLENQVKDIEDLYTKKEVLEKGQDAFNKRIEAGTGYKKDEWAELVENQKVGLNLQHVVNWRTLRATLPDALRERIENFKLGEGSVALLTGSPGRINEIFSWKVSQWQALVHNPARAQSLHKEAKEIWDAIEDHLDTVADPVRKKWDEFAALDKKIFDVTREIGNSGDELRKLLGEDNPDVAPSIIRRKPPTGLISEKYAKLDAKTNGFYYSSSWNPAHRHLKALDLARLLVGFIQVDKEFYDQIEPFSIATTPAEKHLIRQNLNSEVLQLKRTINADQHELVELKYPPVDIQTQLMRRYFPGFYFAEWAVKKFLYSDPNA